MAGTGGGFLRFNILNSGIQDQNPVPGDEGIPTIRNFKFSNVRVKDCPVLVDGTGIHPNKPLDGFSLVNVTGNCTKGIMLANVKNAVIGNVKVTGIAGPLIGIHNVTGKGLEGAAQIDGPKVPEPIPAPAQPCIRTEQRRPAEEVRGRRGRGGGTPLTTRVRAGSRLRIHQIDIYPNVLR